MSKKPERVITKIHTGTGNSGYCRIGGKLTSKTEPIVRYLGKLDSAQSYTHCLSSYRKNVQDYLFILGALGNNADNPKYKEAADLLYEYFETHMEELIKTLPPLEGFIRTSKNNADLMYLRSLIRESEIAAVAAVQEGQLNVFHIKYLNLLSDFVFALVWWVDTSNESLEVWVGV